MGTIFLTNTARISLSAAVLLLVGVAWPRTMMAASFGTENVVTSSYSHSGALSCADVDSDGDIDLVVVGDGATASVTWFENNGNGTSWTQNDLSTMFDTGLGVYAADIETDGDMDLLATARADDTLWVFKNDGSQVFTGTALTTDVDPLHVVATDVNGDGYLDLVHSSKNLDYFPQDSNNPGTFLARTQISANNGHQQLFAADVDNDGDADLIAAYIKNGGDNARVYINDGTGGFGAPQSLTIGSASVEDGIAAGDMDEDGDLDVVVSFYAGSKGKTIVWYEQSGVNSGTFVDTAIDVDAAVDGPRGLFVDDIDGDGVADVLAYIADETTADPDERSVLWWANDGTGTSFTQNSIQTGFAAVTNDPGSVCLADIDGDGLQDVVAAPSNADKISWWAGTATAGAAVANSTALALGWMEECARTWDGSSYVLIAPESGAVCSATTTPLGIWEGFWVLADQELELVIPPRPGLATGNTSESLAGITANQYDLIGVPLDPGDGDAGAVVGDDLGGAGQHEVNWRVAKYNVTTEAYEFYTGPSTISEFSPGRGFWLIHDGSVADPATIDVDGSELKQVVGSPPFDGARIVDLSKPNAGTAKHMAANPFDYTVQWGTVQFRNPQNPDVGITARIEVLPGVPGAPELPVLAVATLPTVVHASLNLEAGEGRLARVGSRTSQELDARALPGARRVPAWRIRRPAGRLERPSTRQWLLDLQVHAVEGPARDLYNRLGVVPGSLDRRDRHDALDLPPFGTGHVRLYFPHDDRSLPDYWRRDPRRLTNDIRRPRVGRLTWIFAVESDLPDSEWILTWPTLHQLPAGIRLTITDLGTGLRFSPANRSEYRFRLKGPKRLFALEADTLAISEQCGQLSGVVTDRAGRPIRATVRVTSLSGYSHSLVTDARGRYRIADLDPGNYTLEFVTGDGTDRIESASVEAGRSTRFNVRLDGVARRGR